MIFAAIVGAVRLAAAPPADIAFSDGHRISSVKVAGRWAAAFPRPLVVGEIYDPAKVSQAIEAVKARFSSADNDVALLGMGLASITYITARGTPYAATRTIDVTILPYSVRRALDERGKFFLPLPRSPFATDVAAVPGWMRMLHPQAKSGEGIFAGFLQAKGATADAAAREAKTVFGGLHPAIAWLAEQANLVALKPILRGDAAQIKAMQGDRRESWLGVGGGVQLVIVTAKLEAGYMATVQGPRLGPPGGFSARLVFQNLFSEGV